MTKSEILPTRASVTAIVQRWAKEGVGEGKVDVFDELTTLDLRDLAAGGGESGRDSVKARAALIGRAFSDRRLTIDELLLDGDRIAWRWTLRALHTGIFLDAAPTGRAITITGVNFQRLVVVGAGAGELRICEHWTLVDVSGLMRQLRVL